MPVNDMFRDRVAVMIHGAGDNSNVWSAVGDAVVGAGVPWIGIDLPGRKDEFDPHPRSIEGLADWTADRIVNQDLTRIVLIGHSMGSLVALEVAGRIPDRVERLVLMCTGTPMLVSDHLLEPESTETLHALITKWSHSREAKTKYAEAIQAHLDEYSALRADTFALDLRACHEYQGAVLAASRVEAPTTVVLAEHDVMVKRTLADPIIEALVAPEVIILDGVGHAIADEAPRETAGILIDIAKA